MAHHGRVLSAEAPPLSGDHLTEAVFLLDEEAASARQRCRHVDPGEAFRGSESCKKKQAVTENKNGFTAEWGKLLLTSIVALLVAETRHQHMFCSTRSSPFSVVPF